MVVLYFVVIPCVQYAKLFRSDELTSYVKGAVAYFIVFVRTYLLQFWHVVPGQDNNAYC